MPRAAIEIVQRKTVHRRRGAQQVVRRDNRYTPFKYSPNAD